MKSVVLNIPKTELKRAAESNENLNISVPAALIANLPKTEDGRPILAAPEAVCPIESVFRRVKATYYHRIDASTLSGDTNFRFFHTVPGAPLSNFNEAGIRQNMIVWGMRLSIEPSPLVTGAAPAGWEAQLIAAVSTATITPIVTGTTSVSSPPYRVADAWGGVGFIEVGAAGAINAWPLVHPSPYIKFQRPLVIEDTQMLTFEVELLQAIPTIANSGLAWLVLSLLFDGYHDQEAFAIAKRALKANGYL